MMQFWTCVANIHNFTEPLEPNFEFLLKLIKQLTSLEADFYIIQGVSGGIHPSGIMPNP
jgi:hypothetical protein